MVGQADGSIIINTELDSQGFDAGSKELHSAISSLGKELAKIGQNLNNIGPTFTRALRGSESAITSFNSKLRQIEDSLEKTRAEIASVEGQLEDFANTQIPTEQYSKIKRAIEQDEQALEKLIQKQEALGTAGAYEAVEKYNALQSQIAAVAREVDHARSEMFKLQDAGVVAADPRFVEAERTYEQAGQSLSRLTTQLDKMKDDSAVMKQITAFQSLDAQIERVGGIIETLQGRLAEMEQKGTAFTPGTSTTEYAELQATLQRLKAEYDSNSAAANKMKADISGVGSQAAGAASKTERFIAVVRSLKTAFSKVGKVGKAVFSSIASCVSSAASSMRKLFTHSKSTNNQFSGLISSAKKFTLSLLGARGVYALLRKAVSAYMSENEDLKSTLDSCWSGIGNLLGPIITKLINLVARATSYVTSFLNLFGVFGNKTSKSINQANAAAKDLKRTVASFDQLNILKEDSSSDSSKDDESKKQLPEVTLPDWLSSIADQIKAGDWAGVGKALATQLNNVLSSIDWNKIKNTVKGWATNIADFLNSFIANTDWKLVGQTVAKGIGSAILFARTLIKKINFSNLGNAIGNFINGFVSPENMANAADAVSSLISGIFTALTTAVKRINWGNVGKSIIAFITNFKLADIVDGATNLVNSLATAITQTDFKSVGNAFREKIANINWKGLWDGAVNLFTSAFQGIGDFLGLNIDTSNLKKSLQEVSEPFSKLFNTIKTSFGTLLTPIVNDLLPSAVNFIGKIAESLSPIITALTPFLSTVISSVTRILNALAPVLPVLGEALGKLVSMAIPIIEPFLNLLVTVVEALAPALDGIFTILGEIFSSLEPYFKIIQDVLNPIIQAIGGIIRALSGVIQFLAGVFTGDWKKAWEGLKNIFKGVWDVIAGIIKGVWEGIKAIFKNAWTFVENIWKHAGNFFKSIWELIQKAFSHVKEWIGDVFSKAWDGVKKVWNSVTGFFSGIWEGIKRTFGKVAEWFGGVFAKAWEAVKKVFSTGGKVFEGIKDGIVSVFKTVVNAIIRGINKVIAIPFNAINGILDGIRSIEIFGIKPFDWIGQLGVPQIPELAQGGVLKKGQIGFLEGDGDEAVVPLERNTGWISKVAEQIAKYLSGIKTAPYSQLREIADTIISGIRGVAQSAVQSLAGIATQLAETIKITYNTSRIPVAIEGFTPDTFKSINNVLTSMGGLKMPQFAAGTVIPYANRAEADLSSTGAAGTIPDELSEFMKDTDEQFYALADILKEILAAIKAQNLNIDVRALSDMITRQQRDRARSFGM